MKLRHLASALAILLTITVVAPPMLLVVPQPAYAQGVPTSEVPVSLITFKTILSEVSVFMTKVAEWANWTNTYILQPIAFVKSGNLMKALTAGVISFAVGTINGTGAPQFVQNISGHMQKVGDVSALSFLSQFGKYSNSPFKASIASSLKANYYQNTSLAGFFVANTSTLDNVTGGKDGTKAFLAGNWSNGGIGAWLALTTQDNNNPYTLYQNAQGKMASVVGSAQAARQQQLSWGQGMLSWCGATSNTGGTSANGAVCTTDSDCASNYCENDGEQSVCGIAPTAEEFGLNQGDSCTNKDGTPGEIKTPGSVIKSSLDKVLGGNQDKLAQVGRMASEIGGIMGSIATVWNTVKFAEDVLGGSGSDSGLFGFGKSVMTSPSNSSAYNGAIDITASSSEVYKDPAVYKALVLEMDKNIKKYKDAWVTIKKSADDASTNVSALIKTCNDNAKAGGTTLFKNSANKQEDAAKALLDLKDPKGTIAKVLSDFETALASIEDVEKIRGNIDTFINSGSKDSEYFKGLINKLQDSKITTDSVVAAEQNATPSTAKADQAVSFFKSDDTDLSPNTAGSPIYTTTTYGTPVYQLTPVYSLTVFGGSTTVGQMNLISENAKILEWTVCNSGYYWYKVSPTAK